MKKMKKILGFIMTLTMLTLSSVNGIAAVVEEEEYLGTLTTPIEETEEYLGNIKDMTLVEAGPGITRAAISFGGSISSGATLYSGSTYYMQAGEGYSYSVTWTPTGQNIKVVRYNVNTGSVYGTSAKSGGAASGSVGGSSVPAGEYKFGVYNAGSKTITSCMHIPQELRIRSGGTERHSASN